MQNQHSGALVTGVDSSVSDPNFLDADFSLEHLKMAGAATAL
jgi:hypothetical protein